jgi:hypothetical protein
MILITGIDSIAVISGAAATRIRSQNAVELYRLDLQTFPSDNEFLQWVGSIATSDVLDLLCSDFFEELNISEYAVLQ